MRACTIPSVIFVSVVLGASVFSACASSGTQPQTSNTDTSAGASASASPSAETAAGSTSEPTQPTAAAPAQKQPETAADCKELKTEITNEPPSSAVPMNNATPPSDAGPSDRLQPMVDIMKSNRDKFRCCFDLWGRKNPGGAGRVTLKVKLKPDGSIVTAETVEKDSTVTAPEVHSCIIEVAKSLSYPRSPSGKETTYTHPFDFKARH